MRSPAIPLPAITVLVAASFVLSGCIVRTAADIVTMPVRVGAKAVDLVTTSDSERDAKRGAILRRDNERLGALARAHEGFVRQCDRGDANACREASDAQAEMLAILKRAPDARVSD